MAEKEESLIQLVLTQDEAMLLGSLSSLGAKILRADKEGAKETCILLSEAIDRYPEATDSLIDKMVELAKAGMRYAEEKLDETIPR